MAIWEIPSDKIINYSKTGDDIDLFTQKVKYCLEEAFIALKELHDGKMGGVSMAVNDLQDGQILVYDAATNNFRNAEQINLNVFLTNTGLERKVEHLQRLVENLYLALDVAELNPGGYDNLILVTIPNGATQIDLTRSRFVLTDEGDKISGDGAILLTTPLMFANPISRAHLAVKHKNIASAQITAELSLNYGDAENFVAMTKTGTYADQSNANRATTDFEYEGAAGTVATLRLTFNQTAGENFWVDSFACMFDE